jgi:hypothetical protein
MENLDYINTTKEELEAELGIEIESAYDLTERLKEMNADEADNGAESVFRLHLKSGKWLFFENINDAVSIEDSGSWNQYFAQWDDGEDASLERFCLGNEISYDEADEDYEGEVKIFIKYNQIDPIYCKDGWQRDDWGDEIRYDLYADATIDHNDRYASNGCFDPTAYIICKA